MTEPELACPLVEILLMVAVGFFVGNLCLSSLICNFFEFAKAMFSFDFTQTIPELLHTSLLRELSHSMRIKCPK